MLLLSQICIIPIPIYERICRRLGVFGRSADSLSNSDAYISQTTIGSLEDPIPLGYHQERIPAITRSGQHLGNESPGEESQQRDTQGKLEQGNGWCACCEGPRSFARGRCKECKMLDPEYFRMFELHNKCFF
jgi:hypothetical protein